MRGDHSSDATDAEPFQGLPPHAWGPREGELPQPLERRSTPTCVGTTDSLRIGDQTVRVYPHMRGDHSRRLAKCRSSTGLPHMRGDHCPRWRQGPAAGGSTPTCVGTTQVNVSPRARTRSTPHAWGPRPATRRHRQSAGLPPQAGDHRHVLQAAATLGGLPPHAGDHNRAPPVRPAAPVYPHMRGTTAPGVGRPPAPAVYPHMRGTTAVLLWCWRRWRGGRRGLPPHAWGPRAVPAPRPGVEGLPPHAWGPL